jgi:hypothetical protein
MNKSISILFLMLFEGTNKTLIFFKFGISNDKTLKVSKLISE